MFEVNMLWIWLLLYIISIIMLWFFKDKDLRDLGFIKYILYVFFFISGFGLPFLISVILMSYTNSLWLVIPGMFLLCIFFTITSKKVDTLFSKDTLTVFLKLLFCMISIIVSVIFLRINTENAILKAIYQLVYIVFGLAAFMLAMSYVYEDN